MSLRNFRVVALATVLFSSMTYLFAWSPVFTVKDISVTGLSGQVSESSLIAASGVKLGEQLARIEPRAIGRNLQEISWIEQADLSRNWVKGLVTIHVSVRVPVGIYQGSEIDSSGYLFELPGNPPAGLPVVSAATPELGLNAIELFTNLPEDFRVSLISLSARNASAISSQQLFGDRKVKIQWGRAENISFKASVYRKLMELPENKNVKEVNLSAPHAPIVK